MKKLTLTMISVACLAVGASAQQAKAPCCPEAKTAAQAGGACAIEAKVQGQKGTPCAVEAKMEARQGGACCKKEAKVAKTCGEHIDRDAEFMAEAHRMMMHAEGKTACCKSTASHPMAKGDKGCCNEKGQPAAFKVYVVGIGYKFFGCEGSAAKGREELIAHGHKVGRIQKITSKTSTL